MLAMSGLNSFGFVQSASWDWQRASESQVSLRSARKRQADSEQPEEGSEAQAQQFTVAIKTAPTPQDLIETLDWVVDDTVFNFFHASAAYTRLAYFGRRRVLEQADWDRHVVLRLHAKVEDMVLQDELGQRQTANILWSLGKLSDRFSVPTELLDALVKSMPSMVRGMDAQGLSNCLWGFAKLKVVAPEVLKAVPEIAAQITNKAKDMKPQELSNSLWASAQLKDVAPEVLKAVPEIAAQITNKAKDMKPQELSNSLWASAQLKDVAPEVLKAVPDIAAHIPDKAQEMVPQALSNCLSAVVQLDDEVPEVLEIVPSIVGEIPAQVSSMIPQQLSNSLEALVLLRDSVPEVASFLTAGGKMDEIVRSAAGRLNKLLPQVTGKDLSFTAPVVVWACAKSGVFHHELLASVAKRVSSRKRMSALPDFGVGALLWSYQVLDVQDEFADFRKFLKEESKSSKRRLSEADVQSCELGRFRWSRA